MAEAPRVEVENLNHPGKVVEVDKAMYEAMRAAMISALTSKGQGLARDAMVEAVKKYLPEALFPGGDKARWWSKTVQLDLEAKGVIVREGVPARWKLAK